MRFHVFSAQNSISVPEHSNNAYVTTALNLCKVLTDNNHEVYHYGAEGSKVDCAEHIDCVMQSELDKSYGDNHKTQATILDANMGDYAFKMFHPRAVHECGERIQPGDFLCALWNGHRDIVNELADIEPGAITVEPGVGYTGCFSRYRVFPSKAFRDFNYGVFHGRNETEFPDEDEQYNADNWTTVSNPYTFVKEGDAVIPHALDLQHFTLNEDKEDYLCFFGRAIYNKGVEMAVRVAEELGRTLILCGGGDFKEAAGGHLPRCAEVRGRVTIEERDEIMGKAFAGLGYTRYIEPFGYVAAEFNATGTAFYTYPWGGLSEIVVDGETGFHTSTFKDTLEKVERAAEISPKACRENIENRFTLDAIAPQFEDYFQYLKSYVDACNAGVGFYHT